MMPAATVAAAIEAAVVAATGIGRGRVMMVMVVMMVRVAGGAVGIGGVAKGDPLRAVRFGVTGHPGA